MKVCFKNLVIMALLFCSGCTAVKPWERGTLAKPIMSLDPDPLETRFVSHVYESKQASSGGYGVGGGGCGCK